MNIFGFMINMMTSKCMAPGCTEKGTHYPHGIPCCDEHYHPSDCGVWLDSDCDCGKETTDSLLQRVKKNIVGG